MSPQKITPIHYRTLVKVFELAGFVVKRQKGGHIIMTKPQVKRPVVIKTRPPQVPVSHIRTNLANAGLGLRTIFRTFGPNEVTPKDFGRDTRLLITNRF